MDQKILKGSCVCGAVRYELSEPFRAFQYCHCSRCRRVSGAPHASNIFVAPAQFRFTAGQDKIRTFKLPEARYWRNAFCEDCGSRVPLASALAPAVMVPAGGLEDTPEARPERNIMWDSRAGWQVSTSELECFATYPGQ